MEQPGYGMPEQEGPMEDAAEPYGAESMEAGGMGQADGWTEEAPLAGEPTGSVDPSTVETQGSSPNTNVLDC